MSLTSSEQKRGYFKTRRSGGRGLFLRPYRSRVLELAKKKRKTARIAARQKAMVGSVLPPKGVVILKDMPDLSAQKQLKFRSLLDKNPD